MTDIKISTIRFDGAQEFGKSSSFQAFCRSRSIVLEPVSEYTHVQNARSENAIRVSKDHVRCLLRTSNVTRNFLPYDLTHFLRFRVYWSSDSQNHSVWEHLDSSYPTNKNRHDLVKDLHVFGSYVSDIRSSMTTPKETSLSEI